MEVLLNKVAIKDPQGKVLGVIGVATDITQRKQTIQMELEIRDANANAMRMLASTMAHELRTPLASLSLATQGIKTALPTLLQAYQLAQQYGLPVATLSRQQEMGLQDVLERMQLKDRQQSLVTLELNHSFSYYGESLLFVHVLFNLLKNALYYIEAEGKGEIKITTSSTDECNIRSIRDTARGIPEHIKQQLFSQFVSYREGGTGVGLAFCKMVMQASGGEIYCKSEFGQFTEFSYVSHYSFCRRQSMCFGIN